MLTLFLGIQGIYICRYGPYFLALTFKTAWVKILFETVYYYQKLSYAQVVHEESKYTKFEENEYTKFCKKINTLYILKKINTLNSVKPVKEIEFLV